MAVRAAPRGGGSLWPVIFVPLFVTIGLAIFSLHRIEEGHVGVYWRGGALIPRVTQPGYHLKIPVIDTYENVQVTLQTDKVTDIPCGTSGGVMIYFEKVEVVNRLKKEYAYETVKNYTIHYDKTWIYDKIHHELNQFCSKHSLQEVYIDLFHTVDDRLVQSLQQDCDRYAPGIEILAIRITKPKIPPAISRNYEQMEAEKTKLMISTEAQRVAEKEAETDRKRATIEAEKYAAVSAIRAKMGIAEKEAEQRMASIQDETYLHHEKALADADAYRKQKLAESNANMLTDAYLKLEMIRSVANNTKIYMGPNINSLYLDWMEKLIGGGSDVVQKK